MKAPVDPLLDHNFDGIQEYDNPLPQWWNMLFLGTIVFSVLYWGYFHMGAPGRTIFDGYNAAVAENLRIQFGELGTLQPDRSTLLKYTKDSAEAKWLKVGESVYLANCVSCHGQKAEGKIGPNLCDDNWKNVKTIEDIAKVINNGAANKAMPAWNNRLHPNEVVLVSAYVASLRGSNPAGPRAPEGNPIPAWDATP